MHPVFFTIPGIGVDLASYGVMLMLAMLISTLWATRRAARSGANPDIILDCGFLALVGGIVGARAMYVIHYWDQFAAHGSALAIFLAVVDVRKGGLEVYGGFILTVVMVLGYLLYRRASVRWYLDILAPSAALGMAIGRIGCYLNGCCWGGVISDLPWAVQFPFGSPPAVQHWSEGQPGAALPPELLAFRSLNDGATSMPLPREIMRMSDAELDAARSKLESVEAELTALQEKRQNATDPAELRRIDEQIAAAFRKALAEESIYVQVTAPTMSRFDLSGAELHALAHDHHSLPVHPTQVYSTVVLGFLALALSTLYWRRTHDGQVIFTLLAIEPLTRFALEVLRADNPLDAGGFTVSQFIAVCMSLVGILGLVALRWLPPRSPKAAVWTPPEEPPAKARGNKRASATA